MSKAERKQKKNPLYHRSVLPNGIVLVTEQAEQFQTLAIGVWVRSGSRDETNAYAGMAHFLEHMMFKGTSRRSALEIARAVDLVGGDFNAMTGREYTCFHITLPVRELRFALELLTEILLDSQFDEVEIDRERKVILQEMSAVEETPEEFIHDEMMEKAFPNHPLGRNIMGTVASVTKFKRRHVVEFFQQHYYSRNLVITVAGDVNHGEIKRLLIKQLKGFTGRRKSALPTSNKTPSFSPGLYCMKRDYDQSHLVIAYESYPLLHPLRFSVFLLNSYLGGGMSSSLFQAIREQRGLAYTVYSSISSHRDSGIMNVYVATSPKWIGTCIRLVREEVAKLQKELLGEEDLLIIKNSLKSAVLLGSDSMETRMMALAKSEIFFQRYISNEEACDWIDEVSSESIREVARDLFSRDPLVIALGGVTLPQIKRAFAR